MTIETIETILGYSKDPKNCDCNAPEEKIEKAQEVFTSEIGSSLQGVDTEERLFLETAAQTSVHWSLYRGDSRAVTMPACVLFGGYSSLNNYEAVEKVRDIAVEFLQKELNSIPEAGDQDFTNREIADWEHHIDQCWSYMDLIYVKRMSLIELPIELPLATADKVKKVVEGATELQDDSLLEIQLYLGRVLNNAGDPISALECFEECLRLEGRGTYKDTHPKFSMPARVEMIKLVNDEYQQELIKGIQEFCDTNSGYYVGKVLFDYAKFLEGENGKKVANWALENAQIDDTPDPKFPHWRNCRIYRLTQICEPTSVPS